MKNNNEFKILILLVVIFTSSCKKDAQEYGDITGIVMDTITGEPLSGVLVSINGSNLSSISSGGVFSIKEVPPGDFILVASKTGYFNFTIQVIVVSNQSAGVTIAMSPSPM